MVDDGWTFSEWKRIEKEWRVVPLGPHPFACIVLLSAASPRRVHYSWHVHLVTWLELLLQLWTIVYWLQKVKWSSDEQHQFVFERACSCPKGQKGAARPESRSWSDAMRWEGGCANTAAGELGTRLASNRLNWYGDYVRKHDGDPEETHNVLKSNTIPETVRGFFPTSFLACFLE